MALQAFDDVRTNLAVETNGATLEVQAVKEVLARVDFGGGAAHGSFTAAAQESSEVDVTGATAILLKVEVSAADVVVDLLCKFKDNNATAAWFPSQLVTVGVAGAAGDGTNILTATYKHGESRRIDNPGAVSFKLRCDAISGASSPQAKVWISRA